MYYGIHDSCNIGYVTVEIKTIVIIIIIWYLYATIPGFAGHVTVSTLVTALYAGIGAAGLMTFSVDGARLLTSLTCCAMLRASPLAFLITSKF